MALSLMDENLRTLKSMRAYSAFAGGFAVSSVFKLSDAYDYYTEVGASKTLNNENQKTNAFKSIGLSFIFTVLAMTIQAATFRASSFEHQVRESEAAVLVEFVGKSYKQYPNEDIMTEETIGNIKFKHKSFFNFLKTNWIYISQDKFKRKEITLVGFLTNFTQQ